MITTVLDTDQIVVALATRYSKLGMDQAIRVLIDEMECWDNISENALTELSRLEALTLERN